jgi:hypothetical protein
MSFRPELIANDRTRAVARMVLRQPAVSLTLAPFQAIVMQAAVEILAELGESNASVSGTALAALAHRCG